MTRSIWKGPFVDGYLLKKAEKARRVRPQRSHQDLEPPLDHPAAVRRPDLRRPQRPQARAGQRHRRDDRPQVRRVRADPYLLRARGRQEGQEEVRWASQKPSARSRTTRPRPFSACFALRARSSTSWPQLIRGKKVEKALAELDLLAQAHRRPGQEDARERHRQRREQPRPRYRHPGRRRSLCRRLAGHEALHGPRPRPCGSRSRSRSRTSPSWFAKLRRPHNGSEDQPDRSAPRHQPHLGFALVREQGRVRQAAAGRPEDPRRRCSRT